MATSSRLIFSVVSLFSITRFQNMAFTVLIPTALQKFTNNESSVECDAESIKVLLGVLEEKFPGIKARLCDDSGNLRRHVY